MGRSPSWVMVLGPTGDPLRNCAESTQDCPVCVMKWIVPGSLTSCTSASHLPSGDIPPDAGNALIQGREGHVLETGHCPPAVAAELRWTMGIRGEAPTASALGYIKTSEAPNQWSFETGCFKDVNNQSQPSLIATVSHSRTICSH